MALQPSLMSDDPTREQLLETVATLRAEVERLKEELRRLHAERFEKPPHYR
jgi:hypothetical protein